MVVHKLIHIKLGFQLSFDILGWSYSLANLHGNTGQARFIRSDSSGMLYFEFSRNTYYNMKLESMSIILWCFMKARKKNCKNLQFRGKIQIYRARTNCIKSVQQPVFLLPPEQNDKF